MNSGCLLQKLQVHAMYMKLFNSSCCFMEAGTSALHATSNSRKKNILLSTWRFPTTHLISLNVGSAKSTANLLNLWGITLLVSFYSMFWLLYLLKFTAFFFMFSSNYLGPLSRAGCSRTFSAQGCDLCLKLYDSPSSLGKHREICHLSAPASLVSCWFVNSYAKMVTCLSFSAFHFIYCTF